MATLSDWFESEARHAFGRLEREVGTAAGPDPAALYAAIRGLRGVARMARIDAVHRAAGIFEAAARALVDGGIAWSADVRDRARATLEDLQELAQKREPLADAQERLRRITERWRDAGVHVPAAPAAGTGAAPGGDGGTREFREYVAREVAGIADVLETSVGQLQANPLGREPLRRILRRQRALLGSARLDEAPDVAEILRALEDLTSVIAKLNIGIKNDWFDIYRVALEALRATLGPLRAGEDPQPSNALKRLRHMREELLERYGTGEVVSAAHEEPGLVQVRSVIRTPEGEAAMPPFVPGAPPRREPADAQQPEPPVLEAPAEAEPEPPVLEAPAEAEPEPPVLETPAEAEPELLVLETPVEAEPELLVLETPAEAEPELLLETPAEAEPDAAARPAADAVLELTADLVVDDEGAHHAAASEADAIVIDDLAYRGEAAVQRARELRDIIAAAAPDDPAAVAAADELLDLVRANAV